MTQSADYLDYNVTGAERKRLVNAISTHTQTDAKYLSVPTCAYEVGCFTIDRNGRVSFDDHANGEEIRGLVEALAAQGFHASGNARAAAAPDADEPATEGLTIILPLDGFDPDSLDRLTKLVDSKAGLIKKSLGADRLTIQLKNDAVSFPWWDRMLTSEETRAYTAFLAALCKMAKDAKRVTATEKDVESEKYAFRSFLLRLGFIGADSKNQRKLLLKNLSGSAAFPNREKADAFSAAQKAKRDAEKEVTP